MYFSVWCLIENQKVTVIGIVDSQLIAKWKTNGKDEDKLSKDTWTEELCDKTLRKFYKHKQPNWTNKTERKEENGKQIEENVAMSERQMCVKENRIWVETTNKMALKLLFTGPKTSILCLINQNRLQLNWIDYHEKDINTVGARCRQTISTSFECFFAVPLSTFVNGFKHFRRQPES